ncbi:RDD family protein [Fibrivirga algicola]|uniref:RDD family protein n=1 Tax=Fibrivirga algicola TaxID=2950420 RepID=A0ABX0QAV1_9BACT|nr:RDD family protein [Fibrivirga algicola]ARK13424.1 transporter [Fibrella sp. ES10-3-2-2]NID08963.1 RDD family protein [Fibrivirga algicola]
MALSIQTTQNVLLDYEPASIGDRILATLLDYVVFAAWAILTVAVPAGLGLFGRGQSTVYFLVVVLIPIFLYDFFCEWLLNGQSIGKIAMKIRVVMMDGSQPGIGAYMLRWLLRLIDTRVFSGIVAVLCVAINGKGQRLGDLAAGTTVIRLHTHVQLNDVTYTNLPDTYQVRFDEVRLLSDQDIQVVREVLRRGSIDAADRTANKLKEVLGVTSTLSTYEFLTAIINDYQYLSMQD